MWLGIGGAVAAIIAAVAVVVLLAKPGTSSTGGSPSSALGPSACVTGKSGGGTGPWKLIQPRTLCGLPLGNSAQAQQANQALLGQQD